MLTPTHSSLEHNSGELWGRPPMERLVHNVVTVLYFSNYANIATPLDFNTLNSDYINNI